MGAFKMPDGSVYKGQWIRDLCMRDGKGMQMFILPSELIDASAKQTFHPH